MKLAILLASTALLASCQQPAPQPAPRAIGIKPHARITHGNRYTATWGGSVVTWIDNTTGHRWTCTYAEFFKYCGGKHPSAMGISVKGKLPQEIAPATPKMSTELPNQ